MKGPNIKKPFNFQQKLQDFMSKQYVSILLKDRAIFKRIDNAIQIGQNDNSFLQVPQQSYENMKVHEHVFRYWSFAINIADEYT